MLTEKDLLECREAEKFSGETFLKGIIDFIKWTSTVAAAAVIWIGSLSSSLAGTPRMVAGAGMLVILLSIVIAAIAIRRVLNAWAAEWNLAIREHSYVLLKKLEALEPSKVTEHQMAESIEQLMQATNFTRAYSRPLAYSRWISCNAGSFMLGLLLYIIALALATL